MSNLDKIMHTGFHSEVGLISETEGRYVVKKYTKGGAGFELMAARELSGHMASFVRLAEEMEIEVNVPYGYLCNVDGTEDIFHLVGYEPVVGRDLRSVIEDRGESDKQVEEWIRQYLDMFRRVWESGHQISLDPPVANFCLSDGGGMKYVDLMPPRQRFDDGSFLSEYPAPPEETRRFIEARYFSPLQARVIYAQLLRTLEGRGLGRESVKTMIGEELGEEAWELVDLGHERWRVLEQPEPEDVDVLRIIAGEMVLSGGLGTETAKEIYGLCHIGVGGILPEKEELITAVKLIEGGK